MMRMNRQSSAGLSWSVGSLPLGALLAIFAIARGQVLPPCGVRNSRQFLLSNPKLTSLLKGPCFGKLVATAETQWGCAGDLSCMCRNRNLLSYLDTCTAQVCQPNDQSDTAAWVVGQCATQWGVTLSWNSITQFTGMGIVDASAMGILTVDSE